MFKIKIKNFIINNFYLFYFFLNVGSKILITYFNIFHWSFRFGFNIFYKPLFHFKGKNIYILGTGESVNEYTSYHWNKIKSGYSIGLNMWILHDFVPDILQLELISDDKNYLDNIIKVFEKRQFEFLETKIFFKSNYLAPSYYPNVNDFFLRIPKCLKQNIYLVADFPIPGNNVYFFEKSIKFLSLLNFFNHKTRFHLMTAQARASLGLSIVFAIQSGFENISLCGVDLYNARHFYDSNNYYLNKYELSNMKEFSNASYHQTNDKDYFELTISDTIVSIYNNICKTRGIKISVGSRSSKLYPYFPFTFIDN
jgi:hypothetical protein